MLTSTFKSILFKALAASGILALALIVAGSLAGPTTASAAGPTTASPAGPTTPTVGPDEHWPLYVQGRPAGLDNGDTNGWYVWHDDQGFHVRTTTPADKDHVFIGVFETGGQFTDVDKVRFEQADDLRLTDGGHKLTVKFHTHDGVDGVNFRVTGDRLSLKLSENGDLVPRSRIFVGADGDHPEDNPFIIHRN